MSISISTCPEKVKHRFPDPIILLGPFRLEMLTLWALSPSKITPLVQYEDNTHGTF
jgi:hypothetical protein